MQHTTYAYARTLQSPGKGPLGFPDTNTCHLLALARTIHRQPLEPTFGCRTDAETHSTRATANPLSSDGPPHVALPLTPLPRERQLTPLSPHRSGSLARSVFHKACFSPHGFIGAAKIYKNQMKKERTSCEMRKERTSCGCIDLARFFIRWDAKHDE
jgi:hypothetical protein